jgi:hypothetical protein
MGSLRFVAKYALIVFSLRPHASPSFAPLTSRSAIAQLGHAFVLRTMGAAEHLRAFLEPMADNAHSAV